MNKAFLISICALGLVGAAQAQNLYKWVDEQGNVTYQDQPPPGGSRDDAFALDSEVAAEADNGAAAAAAKNPVTLYSIPVCDACDLVRNVLQKNGIPFTEKNATEDVSVQDELRKLSGQLSVPLLAVGTNVVYGYNSQVIMQELERAGYPLGGAAGAAGGEEALTPEQVQEQAAAAAAELLPDEQTPDENIAIELEGQPEKIEKIPEDEQIQVNVGAQ